MVYPLYDMWSVYEHRRVTRQLSALPLEILKRYEKWKDIVLISGPPGLRNIKGFHDEELIGEWKGHRSSRLGLQYRVLYKILEGEVVVHVVSLTAHDYRRT
jgi:addiction module RelE/StbE family toxin